MTDKPKRTGSRPPVDRLLHQLQERAKELQCLYKVDEVLGQTKASLEEICPEIVHAIPGGWQYPDICVVQITVDDRTYQSNDFQETKWGLRAKIVSSGVDVGRIAVFYTQEMPRWDDGPFLAEEAKLIQTIADRMANRISQQNMQSIVEQWEGRKRDPQSKGIGDWQIVLKMLKQTDRDLYVRVARKMLNHLCWSGVTQAEELLLTRTPHPHQLI